MRLLAIAALAALGACSDGDSAGPAPKTPVPVRLRTSGAPVEARARPPVPWDRVLAAEGEVAARLELGGETRLARLLVPGVSLRGRVRSPGAGAELVLDVGRSTRGKPERARLLIQAGETRELVELPAGDEWRTVRIPLGLAAGERADVRIVPEADGGMLFAAVAGAVALVPEPAPPLVLLVTSDTHRGDHVGVARRGVAVQTPALDALAARGLWFEDCFAPSHVTLPSHAALFTGTSPRDTGVLDNNTPLAASAPTLAEAFGEAGWLTAAATSLDLLADAHSGFGQGFERTSAPEGTRPAAQTVDVALRWLDQTGGRPLFLWVHVADAHAPYAPPAPFDRKYYGTGDPFDPSLEPNGPAPRWLPEVRDVDYVRALYRGEVSYLDAELGRLLAHPRAARAIVAVTADHGEVLGAHDIWWRHKDLYPDTLHVPLILSWPGGPTGQRRGEPTRLFDLGRSLLDLAGLEDRPFPGGELLGQGTEVRHAVATGRRSASITRGGWHLIQHLRDEPHRVELYDLGADPGCERELSVERRDLALELRADLLAWLSEPGAGWAGGRHADEQTLERLAELGYADQVGDEVPEGPSALPEGCTCAPCLQFR